MPTVTTLTGTPVEDVAHIIQVALTPVFLLSGIGTLINVFNTRLVRVSDHLTQAYDQLQAAASPVDGRLQRRVVRLRRRIMMLDLAVALAGVGGAATCGAAFALFLGGVRNQSSATWLIGLFGAALLCIVAALVAFLVDSVLAWHGRKPEQRVPGPSG